MTLVSVVRYAIARRYGHAFPGAGTMVTRILQVAHCVHRGRRFDIRRVGRGGNSPLPAGSPDKPGFSGLRFGGNDAGRRIRAGSPARGVPDVLNSQPVSPRRSVFFIQGDETHFAMGLLATVFTLATLITTGRIYRMVTHRSDCRSRTGTWWRTCGAANQADRSPESGTGTPSRGAHSRTTPIHRATAGRNCPARTGGRRTVTRAQARISGRVGRGHRP